MSKIKVWGILLLATIVMVALDLLLKYWSVANLEGQPERVLIPGVLGLRYTINTGAAFGLLGNTGWGRWVLSVVNLLLMGGLLWYYSRIPLERRFWLLRIPIIMIFAGGFGNLYDRFTLGYVRDMLEFLFMNFAIFNLADVFVTVGVFLGAFVLLFTVKDAPYLERK